MKHFNLCGIFTALLFMMAGILMSGGCDSGEKAIDGVTGNQAVKQYHKLKKDIGKITDQQTKKLNQALNDIKEGEEKK